MSCVFCEEKNMRMLLLMESEHSYVICSKMPISQTGHFLVIPKRHVGDFSSLTLIEQVDLLILQNAAMKMVREKIAPGGMNVLFNEGPVAGQTVDHFHLHIICRTSNDGIVNFRREDGCRAEIKPEEISYYQNLFA